MVCGLPSIGSGIRFSALEQPSWRSMVTTSSSEGCARPLRTRCRGCRSCPAAWAWPTAARPQASLCERCLRPTLHPHLLALGRTCAAGSCDTCRRLAFLQADCRRAGCEKSVPTFVRDSTHTTRSATPTQDFTSWRFTQTFAKRLMGCVSGSLSPCCRVERTWRNPTFLHGANVLSSALRSGRWRRRSASAPPLVLQTRAQPWRQL